MIPTTIPVRPMPIATSQSRTFDHLGLTLLLAILMPMIFSILWANLGDDILATQIITALTIPVFGYYVYTWVLLREPLFMPAPIFLIGLYVYHFGQFFVNLLGGKTGGIGIDNTLNLFRFPISILHDVQIISWLCISGLQVGALWGLRKYSLKNFSFPVQPPALRDSFSVLAVGSGMTVVAIVPALQGLYQSFQIRSVGTLGNYTAEYGKFGVANVSQVIGDALLPGMLFVASASYNYPKLLRAIFIFFAFWFGINIIIGDRSSAVQPLLAMLWLFNTVYKKINFRLLVAGFAFLAFVVNPIVSITRNAASIENTNLSTIESSLNKKGDTQLLFFDESGISAIPLADTLQLVPSERPFGLGWGMVESVALSPFYYFFAPGHQGKYGNLAYWLIKSHYPQRLKRTQFLGFSPIAEAFVEFGYLAPVYMCGIGYFLVWGVHVALRSRSTFLISVQAISLLYLLHYARGSTDELGRPLIRYIMLPMILMWFVGQLMKTKPVAKDRISN